MSWHNVYTSFSLKKQAKTNDIETSCQKQQQPYKIKRQTSLQEEKKETSSFVTTVILEKLNKRNKTNELNMMMIMTHDDTVIMKFFRLLFPLKKEA